MESGPDFEFVKLWSQLGHRVSRPPKELRVWLWFRLNVLLNDDLRKLFWEKSPKRIMVSYLTQPALTLKAMGIPEIPLLAKRNAKRRQSHLIWKIPLVH